jgi:hypothetical protein
MIAQRAMMSLSESREGCLPRLIHQGDRKHLLLRVDGLKFMAELWIQVYTSAEYGLPKIHNAFHHLGCWV